MAIASGAPAFSGMFRPCFAPPSLPLSDQAGIPYSTAISNRTRLTAFGPVIIRRMDPSFCST